MDQEKIGALIKEIRIKNKMTQKEFADKYGVTYQAVSKWENGKNIPDIVLLKEICSDYNIDINSLLNGNIKPKIQKNVFLPIIILLIIMNIILFVSLHKKDEFSFKTLTSNCNNFNITGGIAFNQNKSSIYISNINYCGGNDTNIYKEINCTLYEETIDKTHKVISEKIYDELKPITLEDYLRDLSFNVDHYSKNCKHYHNASLFLEVNAIKKDGNSITYKIPLKLNNNC